MHEKKFKFVVDYLITKNVYNELKSFILYLWSLAKTAKRPTNLDCTWWKGKSIFEDKIL